MAGRRTLGTVPPVERWATFDCYGTMVDWRAGIGGQLARLFGSDREAELLERYYVHEAEVEEDGALAYRDVMARSLAALAAETGQALPDDERDALGRSLPTWPVFPDTRAALEEARARGWRLGILSNTDRDLIDASIAAIGVAFDLSIVASEIGSYKPAHRHWQAFAERVGVVDRHIHVAQSLYHDHGPARELGIPSIWIDRLGEAPDRRPTVTLPGLTGLADELDALAGMTTLRADHAGRRRGDRGRHERVCDQPRR